MSQKQVLAFHASVAAAAAFAVTMWDCMERTFPTLNPKHISAGSQVRQARQQGPEAALQCRLSTTNDKQR